MKIYVVGIGPGDLNYMVPEAEKVILLSDVIVGYTLYVKLISDLIAGKATIDTGMKDELHRCRLAVEEAKRGKTVAVVSSGDAGIYGMAALLLELLENEPEIELEIVPGITAATAAASMLGAPLSNDFAVVSLSDLMTPWSAIEKRLNAVGTGDFVVCIYNPKSRTRDEHLRRACKILLKHKGRETCCGFVRNALRGHSTVGLCTLGELPDMEIDMLTTIIVGNSRTRRIGNRLVTPRGYRLENLDEEVGL